MGKSPPSPFEEQLVSGHAVASWPMVLPAEAEAAHVRQWLDTVRHRLAVVQFQGFVRALVEHWPKEFVSVKVEVVRNRVLFTTENIPKLSDKNLRVAENALLEKVSPYTENIDQHFSRLVLDGFGFSSHRREDVAGVLEKALSEHPELLALVKQSRLDNVLPEAVPGRSGPRM